jgi:hypothetical protein
MNSKYLTSYDPETEKISIVVKEKALEIFISYFRCDKGICAEHPYKFLKEKYKQNQLGLFVRE